MSFKFGQKSQEKLNGVNMDLIRVAQRALSFGVMDSAVTEGMRNTERQKELFREGKSELDGVTVKSKHQSGDAIDLMPYPANLNSVNVWTHIPRWVALMTLMKVAAKLENVDIRCGGDWKSLKDYPHFEIA